ncbi:hypothetical protein ACAW74_22370 [Fibrella sp. WM1]|uniref:hypothetical protein n=1 Tax=Fibrella musci TaxID=3242485 RepID=UPI003521F304
MSTNTIATLNADWQQQYPTYLNAFQTGQSSYVPNLLPQIAVQFSVYQTLDILQKRLGTDLLRRALDPQQTVPSPRLGQPSGRWLRQSNMVGVNVRTIGSFWNVVNYTLTLPACHDSIHLLPIWEPGVVGSLYGMVSWQINPEFYSVDLARFIPTLDTVDKQLKVVTNLLHALGRTVGMDVIPHTDRFSEMALIHPALFEWVHRDGHRLVDHSENVYRHVEEVIWQFMHQHGTADGSPITYSKSVFFSTQIPLLTDEQRHLILFGRPGDYSGRLQRRLDLIKHLTNQGFETLPMTMAPPYRGLHIVPDDFITDEFGQVWYQYSFNQPQPFSRVFGPLARYKFYHSLNDNRDWQLDFGRPNRAAWEYICRKVRACQQQFNFDFMRGDMAHVQPRPGGVPSEGVPAIPDAFYDPLRTIKHYVQQQGTPHFGFFAETFLAPPDTMAYGDEVAHLEAIDADSTLGDLQSMVVGSAVFNEQLATYLELAETQSFAPNFTVMTADKDDPRFDEFYHTGNTFRYFVSLFLPQLPSYVGLGFEVRNLHLERGANEEYTKLYVFRISDESQTDKVTHGPFVWGTNVEQFMNIQLIRSFAETHWSDLSNKPVVWLQKPVVEAGVGISLAWQLGTYLFSATVGDVPGYPVEAAATGELLLEAANCRVYRVNG